MNYKRKTLVVALSLIGGMTYAQLAHADDSDGSSLQRVDVIGSHIKRMKDEGANPVTSVKVDDLTKQGLTSVEQVVNALAGNQSNVGSSNSVGSGTAGAAYANLRGMGQQYTLVLLDGRRIAYHPFDGTAPDLNSIPLTAIERVDVLRGGAAAIYGSDAVGGVINFVTKKTMEGLSVGGDFTKPQRKDGKEHSFDVSYGYGNLNKDGFNVFGTATYQKTDAIFTPDRDFASAITYGTRASASSYPGNYLIRFPHGQGAPISVAPSSYPNCPAPTVAQVTTSGPQCSTYTQPYLSIQPETEQVSALAKATMLIGDNHQLSATYNITRTKTDSSTAPAPTGGEFLLPNGTQNIYTPGAQGIAPEFRTIPLGPRITESVTTTQKFQLNLEGQLAGWDYRTGAGYSQSYAAEELKSGFVSINGMENLYLSNQISLVTGLPVNNGVLQSASIAGHLDDGKYTMAGADFSLSKEVLQLPAGMLAIAVGGEVRHDTLARNFNYPVSTQAIGPGDDGALNTSGNRTVSALFAEADVPIIKGLDGKAAVRYDHYNDVGDTINPELSLRYQLSPKVLLRTSASTGFRAPSLYDMYQPNQEQLTANYYPDPKACPSMACKGTMQDYLQTGGNTHLKPEKTSSLSVGMVIEPIKNMTASADLWWTMIKDQINNMGNYEQTLFTPQFSNLWFYDAKGNLVGTATTQNMGNVSTAGVDVDFRWDLPHTNYGNFGVELSGTYLSKSMWQSYTGSDYVSNLAQYGSQNQPAFRWQHNLTFNWSQGAWSALLSQTYKSGYVDANADANNNEYDVKPYSTWNLSGTYKWDKHLTLTAGVRNLFDQLPPYSNQTFTFQSNYDPRFTDQVGRAYFMKFNYKL
ncbi:TonB-dependent receptor [Chromobacterium sp. IIBBL 290-4]|uniref:TonB-dependent receptor n=1 Tax=Chromobacterium sp. IIBBL 290-4 TaxID=2953890 RepID=UPI0020B7C19D|nr:TonB-dependent receptor [Chromobacterium sp. IIBBL 290-4]UTH73090.1 TonB-dependent receptor [Chromobacterium sp. IIBBL 290-4]